MELVFTDREGPEERWLAAGGDAEALVAAPVTPVTEELIARMPHLKLIHSDGVGYDRIDLAAAREGGIYVCNCAGCNAGPVAELAVTLMSMLLHRTLWGDRMVRAGQQHEAVNELAAHVPEDLSTCRVGLVGFGAIGQATAQRLRANGSEVFYYARHRQDPAVEEACGARYLPLYELAETCDIISLHLPATPESARTAHGQPSPPAYARTDSYTPGFPLQFPLPGQSRKTSGYGWRTDPMGGLGDDFHIGNDLAAAQGTPVLAAADGVVRMAGSHKSYGNYLRILHADGDETLYAHMQYLFVKAGECVTAGQILGTVGETGNATGPHLHFEILHRGLRYDPAEALQNAS